MTTPIFDVISSATLGSPLVLSALVILLKITLLLLLALGITSVMHRASAGSRHLVWLVALGAVLVLPPLTLWGPIHLRVLPETVSPSGVLIFVESGRMPSSCLSSVLNSSSRGLTVTNPSFDIDSINS